MNELQRITAREERHCGRVGLGEEGVGGTGKRNDETDGSGEEGPEEGVGLHEKVRNRRRDRGIHASRKARASWTHMGEEKGRGERLR